MKQLNAALLGILLLGAPAVHAATVVEEVPDTLPGQGFSGLSAFMAGMAAGGPVAAIGAGLAGAWVSGKVQESTGLHGRAYRIENEDGSTSIVRSPQQEWAIGDQVKVNGDHRLERLEM